MNKTNAAQNNDLTDFEVKLANYLDRLKISKSVTGLNNKQKQSKLANIAELSKALKESNYGKK